MLLRLCPPQSARPPGLCATSTGLAWGLGSPGRRRPPLWHPRKTRALPGEVHPGPDSPWACTAWGTGLRPAQRPGPAEAPPCSRPALSLSRQACEVRRGRGQSGWHAEDPGASFGAQTRSSGSSPGVPAASQPGSWAHTGRHREAGRAVLFLSEAWRRPPGRPRGDTSRTGSEARAAGTWAGNPGHSCRGVLGRLAPAMAGAGSPSPSRGLSQSSSHSRLTR